MVQPGHTHWLDQVLAVPTLGILVAPNFELSVTFAARATGLIARLQREGAVSVASKNPYEMRVQTDTGYSFGFSSDNLIFAFRYPSSLEDRAGGFPIQRHIEPRPYSSILSSLHTHASDAVRVLLGDASVTLLRVGVVAESWIAAEAPPPGLADLVAHLGKPWKQTLQKVSSSLLARLRSSDGITDRCHHRISYDDGSSTSALFRSFGWPP